MLAIQKRVPLPCNPAAAFNVFTKELHEWWPAETYSLSASDGQSPKEIFVEAMPGGRIGEIDYDGKPRLWGQFLDYEPLHRLLISWHDETYPEHTTLIEIVFGMETDGTCVAVLTHGGWEEVYGDDAQVMCDGFREAWDYILDICYVAACRRHIMDPSEMPRERKPAAYYRHRAGFRWLGARGSHAT